MNGYGWVQPELSDTSPQASQMSGNIDVGPYGEHVHSRDRLTGPVAAEFFAGVGLVRLGLEAAGFHVAWSNDIDAGKRDMYLGHFGDGRANHTYQLGDISDVSARHLPEPLSLGWASFPCIDLSLAGWRRGLAGQHSATFYHFTRVLRELGANRPPVVCLENVTGFATSHGGADLVAAIRELNSLGYSVDVVALDARSFVPQSRPRIFMVGAQDPPARRPANDGALRPPWLQSVLLDPELRTHRADLPTPPPHRTTGLSDLIEPLPLDDDRWWDHDRTAAFLESLSDLQAKRLDALRDRAVLAHRTAYRRTRNRKAVWEIRRDDIAGCLRTARGGSSKQALVEAGLGQVRIRWMTPREYARLMGAGEYRLDGLRRNQALFGFGDAVCVPVVTWLAQHYLLPLLRRQYSSSPVVPSLEAVGA